MSTFLIRSATLGLPVNIFKALLPSSILTTRPANLNLLDLISQVRLKTQNPAYYKLDVSVLQKPLVIEKEHVHNYTAD